MDKITASLIRYLKKNGIGYTKAFNAVHRRSTSVLNSTSFCVDSKSHPDLHITIVIEVSTSDNSVIFTSLPHAVYDGSGKYGMDLYANKWNHMQLPAHLFVEEEFGVEEVNKYCFGLLITAFADKDGMSNSLWKRYITHLTKATETAWGNMDIAFTLEQDEE